MSQHFHRLRTLLGATLILITACGGGGGGGGSSTTPPATSKPLPGISISGSAKNITQPTTPPIENAGVEIKADLDGNGVYAASETFTTATDASGFFATNIASATQASKVTVTVKKPGFSDFVKTYENVDKVLTLLAPLSEGSFTEISLTGIEASAGRQGRVSFLGDEKVTLRLYGGNGGSIRHGRATLGREGGLPDSDPALLTEATFPLKALSVPAGTTKMFANVAYLDTVNDPDTMPGGFRTEGGEGAPISMLKTFGASQIEVYDQNGAKLLDDPLDRATDVKIKIAVPTQAYLSLEDENPATTGSIEVPFFYYDAVAREWKLHTNADGTPRYAHLEDNFGNTLTASDLAKLKDVTDDINGNQTTSYSPGGVDPSMVTIYSVGIVHHFSVFNSDARYRVNGQTYWVKDKNGKEVPITTRVTKKNGGKSSDNDSGRNGKKVVHTYTPAQIESAVSKILHGDPETRAQWLEWLKQKDDPALLQALVTGLRQYALDERGAWVGESNELKNGIRALFNNKWTTDTIEETNGVDDNSLDCSKAPDLCKGMVAAASEQVKKSGEAKQAVALLMSIAVETYNPANLNLDYAMEKGIAMAELAVQAGDNKRLQQVAKYINEAKAVRDQLLDLKKSVTDVGGVWPPPIGSAKRADYLDYVYKVQDAMSGAKSMATVIGEKLPRSAVAKTAARTAFSGPAATEEELQAQLRETLLSYKELGGVLFGSYKFDEFKWGYYEGETFVETEKPVGVDGGTEVNVLEYFNGREWTPLPGRSDLGVDAAHIPVPISYSFGDGTPQNPVAYLGTWTLDHTPSVKFRGRVVDQLGAQFKNASSITVYVEGKGFTCSSDGSFNGEVPVTDDILRISIPGYYSQKSASGTEVDLGDIKTVDSLYFLSTAESFIQTDTGTPFSVDSRADSYSGSNVTYEFKYRDSSYGEPWLVETNTTGLSSVAGVAKAGWYYLEVKASSTGPSGPMHIYRQYSIQVKNRPPVVSAITLSNETPTMGDKIDITMTTTDPDGADDLNPYRQLEISCRDNAGKGVWMPYQQKENVAGERYWELNTDHYGLYLIPQDQIACTVRATAYDKSWASSTLDKTFSLTQKQFAPVVSHNYLDPAYKLTYLTITPWNFGFSDRNDDIVEYTVDCGDGSPVVTSPTRINDFAPLDENNYGCAYRPSATLANYTFTATAKDSKANTATLTTQVTIYGPINLVIDSPLLPAPDPANPSRVDQVELPKPDSQGNRSFSVTVGATTPNGTMAGGSYQVHYRPGNYWWWSETLASGNLDTASGQSVTNVSIDKPGHYSVYVYAYDSAGLSASGWKEFTVTSDFDFRIATNGDDALRDWYFNDELALTAVVTSSPNGFTPQYTWETAPEGSSTWTTRSNTASLTFNDLNPLLPEGGYRIRLTIVNTADPNLIPVVREVDVKVYAELSPTLTTGYAYIDDPQDHVQSVAIGDRYTLAINPGSGIDLASAAWLVTRADSTPATGAFTFVEGNLGSRTYTFTAPGTYTVTAQITDTRGVTALAQTQTITVRSYPPVVSEVAASTLAPLPGGEVVLTGTASTPSSQTSIVLYIWKVTGNYANDAGQTVAVNETILKDATGSDPNPEKLTYTFTNAGTYSVSLVVEDSLGQKSQPKAAQIKADWAAPFITSLTADKTSGQKPLAVTFSAVASDPNPQGTITTYAWDVGADDTIEKSGPQATFAHTFTTDATHKVELTVTNARGKSASRTILVTVYDPASVPVFEFYEERVDGLGPAFSLSPSDPHGAEMTGKFVSIGRRSPISVDPTEARDIAATLTGAVGLNGFHLANWGSVENILFSVTEGGIYKVGLSSFGGEVTPVTLTLPSEYDCLKATGEGSAWESAVANNQASFYPYKYTLTTADTYNLLAALGLKNQSGVCNYTAYAFIPAQPAAANASLGAHLTPTFAISHPNSGENQWSFSSLQIDGPGAEVTMWDSWNDANYYATMPKNASGRKLFPYVEDATYTFTFVDLVNSKTNYVITLNSSDLATSTSEIPYAFQATGITTKTLNITNPANGTLDICQIAQKTTACVEALITPSTQTITVPSLTGATARFMTFLAQDEDSAIRVTSDADALGDTLNIAAIGAGAAVTNLTLTADLTQKTLTVDFDTAGDLCHLDLTANLQAGETFTNAYYFQLLAPAAEYPATVSYTVPATPNPYTPGEMNPALDVLVSATARVACAKTPATYRTMLVQLLENLGNPRSLSQSENLAPHTAFDAHETGVATWSAQ